MFNVDQLYDPPLHRAACRISNQIAFFLQPVLHGAERREIAGQVYALLREELSRFDKEPEA